MSRKPKRRKTPEEIAAALIARRGQDLAAVGISPEAAALPSHVDVEVTRTGHARDGQRVDRDAARRLDAFEALRESMSREPHVGAYDAARRLERDMLVSLGQHDHGRPLDRVDCEQGAFNRVDQMVFAAERLDALRQRVPDRDWWLLSELIWPTTGRTTWRAAVAYVTGEQNHNAQGAAVRSACVNLRDAYSRLDAMSRRAA